MFQMLLLLCVLFFTGCSSGLQKTELEQIDAKEPFAVLKIENHNTSAMKVYVVHSGTWFRIGMAASLGPTRIDLQEDEINGGQVTLAVKPLAGTDEFVLNTVDVRKHQNVHLDIESLLVASTATVWHDGR